ncbi:MAG: alpha/beta fold hydrolase [Chloroflexota bacterium]
MSKPLNTIINVLIVIVLVGTLAYTGIGLFIHNALADISTGCSNRENRPSQFADVTNYFDPATPNLTPYFMPTYESVLFESREEGVNLSGWYIPSEPGDPVIISLHGLGSCKYSVVNLYQAGMLHNAGYSVLIMDVRDAGDSDYEDGLSAIGNEEYLDALGGFDWLQAEKGFEPDQIGILGNSLGAATALIAFSVEPELAAAFVDSPFDNLPQIIREELTREGYPQFLYRAALFGARLRGDDVAFHNPHDAITNAAGRPIFITHGTLDERIGVHHTEQLASQAGAINEDVEVWIIEGYDHVKAVGQLPEEYERRLVAFFDEALKGE